MFAAAASFALLAGALAWRTLTPPRQFAATAETPIGGLRNMTLPDGSRIELNTGTAVSVSFSADRRAVELVQGEAHFTVASDPRRPFVVQVGGVSVWAVGTAFSVRRHPEQVEVLVTEGRVDVQDAREEISLLATPVLVAGQRAFVPERPSVARPTPPVVVAEVEPLEIPRRLAWRDHRLEFGPTPLREVVAEFNRYSEQRLVVADPELAEMSLGGTFRAGDADTLVRLLETSFGVVAERRGHETILRRP